MNRQVNHTDSYTAYAENLQKIADIKYALAVLQWDQETYMPEKGADARARQIATLSELSHDLFTTTSFGELLQQLMQQSSLDEQQRANVQLSWYDYEQQKKLSGVFVRKLSEAISKSYNSWIEARKANDFKVFEPALAQLVELKKDEADQLGYEGHRYNAMLNQYERGCTVALLDKVFGNIQQPLKNIINNIQSTQQVNDAFLHQHYNKNEQWNFGMELLSKMGFDFSAGRQDISEHPFTINFNSSDVRITTRIDEDDFSNMTWSSIHELGHALYEQGLPANQYGLPLGEYASLSIHESQSRLWENNVGRSFECWQQFYPTAQKYFPQQLKNISLANFYKGINKVQPSLIRTEADELTYHFHVIIRYELEKKLIEGTLKVKDIPAYWNEQYKNLLGVTVPDDISGCLQDVHWSHGSFGYFPTYSLGSLYAAQFFEVAQKQIPNLQQDIRNGMFSALLSWLRNNIHAHGRKYMSESLCEKITGEPLNIDYFMRYASEKYKQVYNF